MQERMKGADSIFALKLRRQRIRIDLRSANGDERKELLEELEELEEQLDK